MGEVKEGLHQAVEDVEAHIDEGKLVRRVQGGDNSAFDALVRRYYKRIFNMAYRLLGNYQEADDLTQEVFIMAYRKIRSFIGRSSFYTWLYRIAVNLGQNKLKWQNRRRLKEISLHGANPGLENGRELVDFIPDVANNPCNILEKKEVQEYIQDAISSLPEEYRMAVILRDIQGFPYDDIATTLRCSQGTVKSRLNRGRAILRERLKDII